MRTIRFLLLLLLLSAGPGCSEDRPRPPPGRCFTNIDCPEGFECKETYCEDIYFPRREIKPF